MDDRQLYRETFSQVRSSLVINEEMLQMQPKRTHVVRTIAVVAAVICLLLACGVTAVATNLFGLRDLIIAPEAIVGPEGDKETVELISMQGYYDSPEAKACAEWQEFYSKYVPTLNLDNSIFVPGTAYNNYGVYDQTMADKLEEIAETYNLTLYDNMTDLFSESALNDAMGGEFLSGACTFFWGYCFGDGTLQFEGDCSVGAGTLDFQFRRSQKGTLSDVVLNIGHAADYEQWHYTTQDGTELILAMRDTQSLIFTDLPNCFVCVNVLAGTDGGLLYDDLQITKADLELMAECFDWTLCAGNITPPLDSSAIPPEPDQENGQFPADDFYAAATKFPAYAVEDFASTVRAHLLDRNWEGLSECLAYPITIGSTTCNSAEEFTAVDWEGIFTDDFFRAVEAETCHEMFCNSDGIMLADGLMWLAEVHVTSEFGEDDTLKVINIYA